MTSSIKDAVTAIQQDSCVVFPTETVYGLGANALSSIAVRKIFQLKNRPLGNPLIVHVSDIDNCYQVAQELSPLEIQLLELFSPGPLSLILPKKDCVPNEVSGGLDTVGVRIPKHPIALEFLKAVRLPICAPSANISGKPSPTTFEMAQFYMKDKAILLDGGDLHIGIESTVVKVVNEEIMILRSGFITAEMLQELDRPVHYPKDFLHESPGTQYAHYQPNAKVILFTQNDSLMPDENSAMLCLTPQNNPQQFKFYHQFDSILDYMKGLYASFFQCDQRKINTIYCELPPHAHQGIALRDRLSRAAGH